MPSAAACSPAPCPCPLLQPPAAPGSLLRSSLPALPQRRLSAPCSLQGSGHGCGGACGRRERGALLCPCVLPRGPRGAPCPGSVRPRLPPGARGQTQRQDCHRSALILPQGRPETARPQPPWKAFLAGHMAQAFLPREERGPAYGVSSAGLVGSLLYFGGQPTLQGPAALPPLLGESAFPSGKSIHLPVKAVPGSSAAALSFLCLRNREQPGRCFLKKKAWCQTCFKSEEEQGSDGPVGPLGVSGQLPGLWSPSSCPAHPRGHCLEGADGTTTRCCGM